MKNRSKVWVRRAVLLAVAAFALLGAGGFAESRRIDPATVSQDNWHELATESPRGKMHPFPKRHPVDVAEPDKAAPVVLMRYLPPPVGSGGMAEKQGQFDPESGHIEITGDLARLQACYDMRAVRPILLRTLRHEYGHAFLCDWLAAHSVKTGSKPYLAYTEPGAELDPAGYPKELRDVVREYQSVPRDIYGQEYLTSTFDEYVAESYGRFVSGEDVPPKVGDFLARATDR